MIGNLIQPFAMIFDAPPPDPLSRTPGVPGFLLPAGGLLADPSGAYALGPFPGTPRDPIFAAAVPGVAAVGAILDGIRPFTVPATFAVGTMAFGNPYTRSQLFPPAPPRPYSSPVFVTKTGTRKFRVVVGRTDHYLVRYSDAAGLRIDPDRAAVLLESTIYLPAGAYDVAPAVNPNTGYGWIVYITMAAG